MQRIDAASTTSTGSPEFTPVVGVVHNLFAASVPGFKGAEDAVQPQRAAGATKMALFLEVFRPHSLVWDHVQPGESNLHLGIHPRSAHDRACLMPFAVCCMFFCRWRRTYPEEEQSRAAEQCVPSHRHAMQYSMYMEIADSVSQGKDRNKRTSMPLN